MHAPVSRLLSPTSHLAHPFAPQQDNTQKVDAARRYPGIRIVWLNWLTDSLALWGRQDETPYLLHPTVREDASTPAAVASPASDAHQISSDPDPDADDWDELGDSGSSSRALGVLGVEGPGPGPDHPEQDRR